ncbi:hypothetical protein AB7M47_008212 [Bradyrhizobium elkanii]|nr:hypothetical protein [Bradyrhizobium elkanii]WLA46681.1 hypothetical protein QIH80_33785 [Bradyrhizobium elkanii]WLB83035.1 hypothetical protein QIH83_10950 [Bradyrhizobium elkanii]
MLLIIDRISHEALADQRLDLVGSLAVGPDGFAQLAVMDILIGVLSSRDGAYLEAIAARDTEVTVDKDCSNIGEIPRKAWYAPFADRDCGQVHQDVDIRAMVGNAFHKAVP